MRKNKNKKVRTQGSMNKKIFFFGDHVLQPLGSFSHQVAFKKIVKKCMKNGK
jgi:hypothetical protein